MELTIDVIKDLIESLGKSGVDVMSLDAGEFKLKLEKRSPAVVAAPMAAPAAVAVCETPAAGSIEKTADGEMVTSPIVGTYYSAASPDKPPFAAVGQTVKKGDIIYIVESMKLMNEIASEFDGLVTEIMIKNGQSVEYGQPIMRITKV